MSLKSNVVDFLGGSCSDYDLDKDLHPLNHYLNDREEMINQVFKVIKGRKLRAMLTSGLRDLDTKELKSLCLTQLEGMSKRRIKYILAGREMDESSATDDSEEEDDDDEQLEQENQGMAGPLVDDIQTSLLNRKSPDDVQEEPIEIKDSDEEAVEDEEEEEEELNDIIDRRTKDLTKKAKLDLQLVKKTKGTKAPEPEDKQKIMELLELEMRARAIKSLLSKTKKGDKSAEDPPILGNKDKVEEDEDEKVELIKEPVDPEEEKRQLEEQKRLHKAREALSISNAKKRKEEQELERKREEIKKRIEEREAKKKAEAEALRKKEEAEAEKKRKKEEREAEYQRLISHFFQIHVFKILNRFFVDFQVLEMEANKIRKRNGISSIGKRGARPKNQR